MRFDGSTAWYLDGFLNTVHVTWSAWVKPRTAPPASQGGIVGFTYTDGANDKLIQYKTDGTVYAYAYDGADKFATSTAVLKAGIWQHVALTADGSTLYLYITGAVAASTGCGNTYAAYGGANLRVGGNIRSGGASAYTYFDGEIERVGIWTEALTGGQVAMLAAGYPEHLFKPESLLSVWPFNGPQTGVVRSIWPANNPAGVSGFSGPSDVLQQSSSTWPGSGEGPPLLKTYDPQQLQDALTLLEFRGGPWSQAVRSG